MEKIKIIAEIGINHSGSRDKAIKMIGEAASAGADSVKFQTFKGSSLYSRYTASYLDGKPLKPDFSLCDFFRSFELSTDDYIALKNASDSHGVEFMSSPFDSESVDMLESLGVKTYKIASGSMNDLYLIEKILSTGKNILASTGLIDQESLDRTVNFLKTAVKPAVLLHCVSIYPLPDEHVNLSRMLSLKERYGLSAGFSDHSPDKFASVAAAAMGACVIEKHFKCSEADPDAAVSLGRDDFKDMVDSIRRLEKINGSGEFSVSENEKKISRSATMSLCLRRNVKAGEKITRDVLCAKRPGTGLTPFDSSVIEGRRVSRDMAEDELLSMNDLNED